MLRTHPGGPLRSVVVPWVTSVKCQHLLRSVEVLLRFVEACLFLELLLFSPIEKFPTS